MPRKILKIWGRCDLPDNTNDFNTMDVTFFENVTFFSSPSPSTQPLPDPPIALSVPLDDHFQPSSHRFSNLPIVYTRRPKDVPRSRHLPPSPHPSSKVTMCRRSAHSSIPTSDTSLQSLEIGLTRSSTTDLMNNLSSIRIPIDHKEAALHHG